MIIKLSEPIYGTSLKLIIGELLLFSKLFPNYEFKDIAMGYTIVDGEDGTIWMEKYDIYTLDHELTHFMAGVGEYLGLQYNRKDELMPHLRNWYLGQILKKIKRYELKNIKK